MRVVGLCTLTALQARSSHWSINAAVMGTLPELHYEKKKKKEHPLHLLQRQDDAAGLCGTRGAHKHKVCCTQVNT